MIGVTIELGKKICMGILLQYPVALPCKPFIVNPFIPCKHPVLSLSVVRDIGGHGVGLEFHEDPWVSYVCPKDTGMLMVPGMVFTIEPMINMGKEDIYISDDDGWTVHTEDGLPSAQWEIQVLVTEDGYEIISY